MTIKLDISHDLILSIAEDLSSSDNKLSVFTKQHLHNVIKETLNECEKLQPEVDNMIDAVTSASEILKGAD